MGKKSNAERWVFSTEFENEVWKTIEGYDGMKHSENK